MKVAVIVGHTKCKAEGAYNETTGLTEWEYNRVVAAALKLVLAPHYECKVFLRPDRQGLYRVSRAVNLYEPDFAISLHANAANRKASGAEVLYWHSSKNSRLIAEYAAEQLAKAVEVYNRGAKPVKKGERGWYILAKVACPIILCEPYFIDNDNDLRRALVRFHRVVGAYAAVIEFAGRLLET